MLVKEGRGRIYTSIWTMDLSSVLGPRYDYAVARPVVEAELRSNTLAQLEPLLSRYGLQKKGSRKDKVITDLLTHLDHLNRYVSGLSQNAPYYFKSKSLMLLTDRIGRRRRPSSADASPRSAAQSALDLSRPRASGLSTRSTGHCAFSALPRHRTLFTRYS